MNGIVIKAATEIEIKNCKFHGDPRDEEINILNAMLHHMLPNERDRQMIRELIKLKPSKL